MGDARGESVLSCPICRRPVPAHAAGRPASFPFCSSRCRDRDLGAWWNGRYQVPGDDIDTLLADAQSPYRQADAPVSRSGSSSASRP